MKRLIYDSLLEWKASPRRKPLILLGARQVGKTYILKEFGKNEYASTIYVNCHNNSFASTLFSSDFDIDRILLQLEAYSGVRPKKETTLIIFDEIQEIKNGVASLKYFCEDAREYHVAVAGSLLGISLRGEESYPVGKVDLLHMYPMGFEEFLTAKGEETLGGLIKNRDMEALASFHDRLTMMLRLYYFVGGMPEAVSANIAGATLAEVRKIQNDILDAYYRDMAKHTDSQAEKIRMVWNSVAPQLARENKKFIFGAVRKGARARDFEESLQWLADAGLVIQVREVTNPVPPLKFYAETNAFKLYMLDIGMLGAMMETSAAEIISGENPFREYKGAFTENYVAQQLQLSLDKNFFYYTSDKPVMEIDFLYSSGKEMTAIEVKAETNVRSKSLRRFHDSASDEGIGCRCLRFSMLPFKSQEWMTNYPLYCVFGAV